jgi:hypothetical protein
MRSTKIASLFLNELDDRGVARLALVDMRRLIGLCRLDGLDLPRFKPAVDAFDEAT